MTALHPPCAFSFFDHLPFVHSEGTCVVSCLLLSFRAAYQTRCVSKVGLVCGEHLALSPGFSCVAVDLLPKA